jgi:toxin FitB
MYLLDTCTISDVVAKQPHPNVLSWFTTQPLETVYLSVVTIGELTKGIQNLNTMVLWGELTGRLESQGRMLPTMDSLIAAVALQHSLTLVTRNEKDFAGTGVTIFNPWN